jgi:hypothetical protein
VLVEDPAHELKSFTVSLSCNAGPARGQGRGSFVDSVLTAVDKFYSEVVQHVKPWTPAPPKIRDGESSEPDEPMSTEDIVAADGNRQTESAGTLQVEGAFATASRS